MARDPRAVVRAWGVVLGTRIPWLRSMRVRAMAVVVAVVLMPLLLVAIAGVDERRVGARLARNVREGVEEAAEDPSALDAIARRSDLRIRVFDAEGSAIVDVDHEAGTNPLASVGALFFGDDGAPSPRAFDDTLGPVLGRTESRRARAEQASDPVCRTSEGAKLLACGAARIVATADGPHLVYAQASSRRAVRALYDLRYEISKLVVILLPVGMLLAWWLGWRTVRPIEMLREQVLAQAADESPRPQVDLPRRDEIGDLAVAFNGLLRTLDERRLANEAFVADLVHEFKNPVAAIRASAEQLRSRDADPRTERLARILEASSERLDALVTQFLELARAEAGMPSEARTPTDLAELARGIVESVRADVRWSGVTFAVRSPAAAIVPGVALRLESALRNLIENAASFAAPAGEVEVRVEPGDDAVELSVRDTGAGIAEVDVPRVFDRFFTTRGGAQGTGLGLALVKAVIVAHGGDVHAESAPGKGATFSLTLPR
ncbi:MAG: sensor histidine kinase [Polyangiaceae bacterium]